MAGETATQQPIQISDAAWKALEGAYDLQVHVGPDVIARRIDDIDCAREFLARGMRGFILKSHYIQTGERAQVVTKAVPGIRVFGAVTLNHSVGGLNPVAVELAGRTGCKIVGMPTGDAQNETAGRGGERAGVRACRRGKIGSGSGGRRAFRAPHCRPSTSRAASSSRRGAAS